MKATLVFFLGVVLTVSALAQGTVQFNNTATTQLTTNSSALPPPGQLPNQSGVTQLGYTIGLYIAPQGTTDPNAFTLMGPTTPSQSGLGNGRFNGNPLPNNFVISNNTGQTIAFQVRAWSTAGGTTFAQAISSLQPGVIWGTSSIGEVTPAIGLTPTPALFGTAPGQVGGFVLLAPLPEPSTNALIVLGVGIGFMFLKRSRHQQR